MTSEFFAASNVLVVAGKGGVGKTTVGASIGIAAARTGCDVLLVELEGHSSLATSLGLGELRYEEQEVALGGRSISGRLRIRQISPDDALADYLERAGLGPLASRLSRTGAMEVVSTAAPGIRDLLTLGKIRQLEQASAADLIVIDAPAAGHALTFLTAASGLAASTTTGPVRDQADLVLEMFADPDRCQVLLVTLPEETPVSETIETAYSLEEDVDIKLAPVVVNAVWSPLSGLESAADHASADASRQRSDGQKTRPRTRDNSPDGQARLHALSVASQAAAYRLGRQAGQQREMARLAKELPLDQIVLPFIFEATVGVDELMTLADVLGDYRPSAPT